MRIIFAGTPEFAVPSLISLAQHQTIVAIYTQPDRPAGRRRQLAMSAVKQQAIALGLPIEQPQSLNNATVLARMGAYQPDLMIVVAYGLILPAAVLAIPRYGCWNVHASLLPRWRGAAPIQRAIAAGDQLTGVCLMQMAEGLDTGPVILQRQIPITSQATAESLQQELAQLGADVLDQGLSLLQQGRLPKPQVQNRVGVSYAQKLSKSEARFAWSVSADMIERMVRAYYPWPIAEAILAGERIRIHQAVALTTMHSAQPGQILDVSLRGLDIACGLGVLRLQRVQRDGGQPISAFDYYNARRDDLAAT